MSAVPISQSPSYPQGQPETHQQREFNDWMKVGVAGTLLTGSVLLLTGKRKAGLLVTAAGTALAILQEQETVAKWWNALPRYLDDAQHMLDQAQSTIEDLTSKRDKLMSLFGK